MSRECNSSKILSNIAKYWLLRCGHRIIYLRFSLRSSCFCLSKLAREVNDNFRVELRHSLSAFFRYSYSLGRRLFTFIHTNTEFDKRTNRTACVNLGFTRDVIIKTKYFNKLDRIRFAALLDGNVKYPLTTVSSPLYRTAFVF